METSVRRRDPRFRISTIQILLGQLRAANLLFEHEGWRIYVQEIEKARARAVERLATDKDADLRLEQATIAVYTELRECLKPNPTLVARLENELQGLQKEADALQDAGLLDRLPKGAP